MMATCVRCCLRNSMRVVNLIMLLFGIGMIIYSLWLQKKWNDALTTFPPSSSLPVPWFIYTCFGVGIVVCLSTLGGYMVANFVSNPTICLYIVMICCLLFLEVAVVVAIFFKIDWAKRIAEYIDAHNEQFETFVIFHVKTCRWIIIMIAAAQINVVILSIVLWAVGTEPTTHCSEPEDVPHFTQSFLVPNSPGLQTLQACRTCSTLWGGNRPRRGILSRIKSFLTSRFRWNSVS